MDGVGNDGRLAHRGRPPHQNLGGTPGDQLDVLRWVGTVTLRNIKMKEIVSFCTICNRITHEKQEQKLDTAFNVNSYSLPSYSGISVVSK